MITPDTLEIFPHCPTFGMVSEPQYLVSIVEREGGYERRDRKWARPLNRYSSIPMGNREEEVIQDVLEFWHAVGGRSEAFRYLDFADYKSVQVQETPTALDQPLVETLDSPGVYQLTKLYTYGARTQIREIYKPKGSTILIANTLGAVQPSSSFTVSEIDGTVTPEGGFTGTPGSWGGEFYVKVRFDSEFPVELTERRIAAVSFSLKELRE